jgi:hypothetical protein
MSPLEYADIPKVFFTPHHVGHCCTNVVPGHCCTTMSFNNDLPIAAQQSFGTCFTYLVRCHWQSTMFQLLRNNVPIMGSWFPLLRNNDPGHAGCSNS